MHRAHVNGIRVRSGVCSPEPMRFMNAVPRCSALPHNGERVSILPERYAASGSPSPPP